MVARFFVYLHYFCNLHFSTNENLLFSSYSIGNINPFRWKSHYFDTESGLYYANGSYYDPEVVQYVDASPIEAVEENAYVNHSLDRNNILCNNIFLLVAYLCGIFTIEDLSCDFNYDADDDLPWYIRLRNWFARTIAAVLEWLNNIHWSVKLIIGIVLLVAAIVLTIATEGAAAVPILLANVAIGTAIGVASWAIMTLLAGEALTWEGALNAFVDSFLASAFSAFVAAGTNAISKIGRTSTNPVEELCENGQCFMAGTLVLCKGSDDEPMYKAIEEIMPGDLVWAFDEQTETTNWKPVVRLFRNKATDWIEVIVDGTKIVSTPEHRYYLPENKEWQYACNLTTGEQVLLADGTLGTVEKVTPIHFETPRETYNFEVADYHTYYVAQGVLVHNKCVYRGGDSLDNVRSQDIEIIDDMVQPERGISVNSNPNKVVSFGKPHKVGKLPSELRLKHTGGTHYEIVPRSPMSLTRYKELLRSISLTQI